MSMDLIVKINNQDSSKDVRVINPVVVVTWDWDATIISVPNDLSQTASQTYIDQNSYEVRIGTFSENIGTSTFLGDMDSTDVISSSALFGSFGW